MWTREEFQRRLQPPVIGMIHLPALPGAPAHAGGMAPILDAAMADLEALAAGGVRAAMVENFHDSPFWPERVPPETVAAMAVVLTRLADCRQDVLLGVNVLRNDAEAALALAGAVGAAFIRVNVHTGAMLTDQGPVIGQAHRTLRRRRELGLDHVGILADLRVKHAAPLAPRDLAAEAVDLRRRGLADALIISGAATGAVADPEALARVREVLPDCPLLVGSGVTPANVADYLAVADGCIVGTSLQAGGRIAHERAAALVASVARPAGDRRKDPA